MTPQQEEAYGRAMARLAMQEGHTPGLPEMGSTGGVTDMDRERRAERRERVALMAKKGMQPAEIARIEGVSASVIRNDFCALRLGGTVKFNPGADRIIAEVAAHHEVAVGDILGRCREPRIVKARFEAISRVQAETGMSLPSLCKKFGRDHTSILNALHRHRK